MVKDNKVLIFTKNSPWGVIKHPTKGNIYKHIINFPTDRKIEFVEEYLNEGYKSVGELLNDIPKVYNIKWINEYKFQFITNITQQGESVFNVGNTSKTIKRQRFKTLSQLAMSDIACTFDSENNLYYWTLKVIDRDHQKITFEAELDIFFTYDVNSDMFFDTTNYIEQAHMKRWQNKDINYTIWDNVLKNEFDFTPTVQSEIKLHNVNDTPEIDFWILITFISGVQDTDNVRNITLEKTLTSIFGKTSDLKIKDDLLFSKNINVSYNKMTFPYCSMLLPFSRKKKMYFGNNTYTSGEIINRILEKADDGVFNISIISDLCIGDIHSNKPYFTITEDSVAIGSTGDKWYRVKINSDLDVFKIFKPYTPFNNQDSTLLNPKSQWYFQNDLEILMVKDLSQIDPYVFECDNPIGQVEDPIELHPSMTSFVLETWNGEKKVYDFHRINPNTDKWKIVKCLNFLSPTNNGGIAWIKQDTTLQRTELLNTSYLNVNNSTEIPYTISKLNQYMRDNKNAFEARKDADVRNRNFGIVSDVLTSTVALAVALKTGGLGTAFLAPTIASSISNLGNRFNNSKSQEELRNATINDLKNQVPNTHIGQNPHTELIISNVNSSHRLKFSMYQVPQNVKDRVLSQVKIYGYQVKEHKKLKELLNTRERFNYIQTLDVFNSIKLKLSPTIKQIIASAFLDGLTIWHYRSKLQWKGLLNYDEENGEVDD